jgi:hypothetical protein
MTETTNVLRKLYVVGTTQKSVLTATVSLRREISRCNTFSDERVPHFRQVSTSCSSSSLSSSLRQTQVYYPPSDKHFYFITYAQQLGAAVAQLVEALRYKPAGRGFLSALWPWGHSADSAEMSTRNISWGVNAAGA